MQRKPSIFIGSSTEGLPIAYAIQKALERSCEPTVWTEDVFKINQTALDSLLGRIRSSDFAILIFTPDDKITQRGTRSHSVRDNVVFELGLFMGWLGKERCFVFAPRSNHSLRIPSDLLGRQLAEWEANREDGNIEAAVTPAIKEIERSIRQLGPFSVSDALLDAEVGKFPSQATGDEIAGFWLSRFEFSSPRMIKPQRGVQYDLELLESSGSRTIFGSNVVSVGTVKRPYMHRLRGTLVGSCLIGNWFNQNSQNLGAFQLHIYNTQHAMQGRHIGNSSDNRIRQGVWSWIRLDAGAAFSSGDLNKLRMAGLKDFVQLEKAFKIWFKEQSPVSIKLVLK